MNAFQIVLSLGSVVVCALGGDISGMDPKDATQIQQQLPGVVIGKAEIPPTTHAAEWLPLRKTSFEYVSPSGKAGDIKLKPTTRSPGSPVGDQSGGWRMIVSDGLTRYLRPDHLDHQASIVIPTDVSTTNGLLIRLNPPEPLLLDQHHEDRREMVVKVYDVHEPTVVTHSGSVSTVWTDLGGWRVKTPAGEFDTRLVRLTYNGSVGPASVTGSKYTFYAHGIGPVAYTDKRDVSAFLFFNDDTDHAGVLKRMSPSQSPSHESSSERSN